MSASPFSRKRASPQQIGLKFGLVLAAFLGLAACATAPTEPDALAAYNEANDPLEPANRAIFEFNLFLDDNIVKPVAEAYRVVPEELRKGLHNMILTVRSPPLFANYVMQGNPDNAADIVLRLVINLTAGVGGFFDVATMVGIPAHDTDFGVTLAKWGAGEGFYLMLPFLGPSNPRDGIGLGIDSLMDPIGYFATIWEDIGRFAFEGIDKREPLIEPLDELRRTSVDYYATIRSLYRQHRDDQIRAGKGGANFPAPSISGAAGEPSADARPPVPDKDVALVAGRTQAGAEVSLVPVTSVDLAGSLSRGSAAAASGSLPPTGGAPDRLAEPATE
ncbi:MAG TPA: VacJ family lipoprotein [Alphaproteobacteria bacterium]|nr:VacJ family lipoprotein [Alphaproteobacteria bacterium]